MEYFDEKRLPEYLEYARKALENNVEIRFYKANREKLSFKSFFKRLRIDYYRFSSVVWCNESGGTYFEGKLKKQKIVEQVNIQRIIILMILMLDTKKLDIYLNQLQLDLGQS